MIRALFLLLLFVSICQADTALLPAKADTHRERGFHALYNMRYEESQEEFNKLIREVPDHPAGYIYLAGSIWLEHLAALRRLQTQLYNRNDSFFAAPVDSLDATVDKNFTLNITRGIELAENRLDKDSTDLTGLYYLGIARGAVAAYESTVKRSFFASLKNGARAVDLHRRLLRYYPSFTDAYVSVGMYDYVVGSLPLAVKIMAFLGGVHGSKKNGLAELERVSRDGHFARVEAEIILVLLYDREKRFSDSLKLLQQLSEQYPGNIIFRMELGRALSRVGRSAESAHVFERLEADHAAMDYIGDMIHYHHAQSLFDARDWEKAREHYIAASYSRKASQTLISMARLEAGKCLDANGKRRMAEAEYQFVLKMPDVSDSHDQARKYLKKPYVPEPQVK